MTITTSIITLLIIGIIACLFKLLSMINKFTDITPKFKDRFIQ